MFRSFRTGSAVLALAAACCVAGAQQKSAHHKVVVISLDAFGAESLRDPHLPAPTLHALMNAGSYARAMNPINPTVTCSSCDIFLAKK